ncbi:MAG: hypothetical protein ACFFCX_10605 [Candidatus Sifarchaeia archaeon]
MIGVSLTILGFVGFSLKKQYRYATQLFDMLRLYPLLTITFFVILFARGLIIDIPISDILLLVSPFLGLLGLILLS